MPGDCRSEPRRVWFPRASTSRTRQVILSVRSSSDDCCAMTGLRVYKQLSIHQLQPFTHADQSQSSLGRCIFWIETCPKITHRELNIFRGPAKVDLILSRSAVFHRIVKRFLQHSKQGK